MCFYIDRSRRRIRLEVKCVIIATLICPEGGVNSGSSVLLEMIHSMTQTIKWQWGECALTGLPLQGDLQGNSHYSEHNGFFAHQKKLYALKDYTFYFQIVLGFQKG